MVVRLSGNVTARILVERAKLAIVVTPSGMTVAGQPAMSLFVARSTLLNRLVRIDELTHVDLEDLKERIYLGLSLEMLA